MITKLQQAKFGFQCIVSLTVIGFCIGMLSRGEDTQIYLPVLTGTVGYWLPQPSLGQVTSPTIQEVVDNADKLTQRSQDYSTV